MDGIFSVQLLLGILLAEDRIVVRGIGRACPALNLGSFELVAGRRNNDQKKRQFQSFLGIHIYAPMYVNGWINETPTSLAKL